MPRLLAGLIVAALLSGCADAPAPAADAPSEPAPRHDLEGRVLTPAFNPIPQARVWVGQSGLCTADGMCTLDLQLVEATTAENGSFRLEGLWAGQAVVHVEHPDYEALNATVQIPAPRVDITLVPFDRVVPFQVPFSFQGHFECGADHLIFAGSCDEFVGEIDPTGTVQGTFADEREFPFDVEDGWRTIIVDVSFEDATPTIDGLRVGAYDGTEEAGGGNYQRYHQAGGSESFTLRLDSGTDYGDELPAPEGAAPIRLEVFPRGHGYYQACDPTGENFNCLTGLGVSPRIDFEILVTVFYHEAAPPGWSLLA